MCLCDRIKNPAVISRVGITLIGLAILSRRFLRPQTGPWADGADFLTGLLYGLALPFLVWSLVRFGRGSRG